MLVGYCRVSTHVGKTLTQELELRLCAVVNFLSILHGSWSNLTGRRPEMRHACGQRIVWPQG
jgi:hypothetical protein